MNKYELALVVNAKIEDDARAAVVEKAQGYITRFGGVVSEVEEWGKKKLAYDIQKMSEGYYYFIQFGYRRFQHDVLFQTLAICQYNLSFGGLVSDGRYDEGVLTYRSFQVIKPFFVGGTSVIRTFQVYCCKIYFTFVGRYNLS